MATDFYQVLGVSRNASKDELQRAYRKLARKFHPDRNPGDKQAETRFKEVQEAYDVLGDEKKRAQYDRFGSVGPDGGFGGWDSAGPRGQTFHWSGGPGGEVDPSDILRQFFGGGAGPDAAGFEEIFGRPASKGSRRGQRAAPREVESRVTIPFVTAALGGAITVRIETKEIEVKIPPGVSEGQSLRLQGQAPGGGNLRLVLHIEPHEHFRRDGNDIILTVPLSFDEATLGAQVDVPTIDGAKLTVRIPPGTSSGNRLRLRGKGIKGGDQYIEAKVVVPAVTEEAGRKLVEELAALHPQKLRTGPPFA